MGRIGVVTFHYALNFGSILQAQATQIAIERMGHDCEIIDYRFVDDKTYDEIYILRNCQGKARFNRVFYMLQNRTDRIDKFCTYRQQNLKLSNVQYHSINELKECAYNYDLFVSGSDQIWSDRVPEVCSVNKELTKGYYLSFTEKPKISYASCIANMKENELVKYRKLLDSYSFISTREKAGAKIISRVTGQGVSVVLDPSFLLTKEEWGKYTKKERLVKEKYVLLYSLRDFRAQISWLNSLRRFRKYHNLRVVVLAPYFSLPMIGVINMIDAGPSDFLNLVMNAEVVVTDSFHGTAFATNFNVPVYSLGNKYWKEDPRKIELLTSLGMENRLIHDESEICNIKEYKYDYTETNKTIDSLRRKSLEYLDNSLKEAILGRCNIYSD